MKDRLATLALAAGALLLFYLLLFPKPQNSRSASGLPVSTDTRPDGYGAIWRWLGEQHIPRVSLRYRYTHLPQVVPHPKGNVLLITLPQRLPMHARELAFLRHWVAQGNTVLIAAALDDTPSWLLQAYDPLELKNIRRLTGLQFKPSPAVSALRELTGGAGKILPRAGQPLMRGVRTLQPVEALPARTWQASLTGTRMPVVLATLAHGGEPAVWLLPLGAGQIVLSSVASPFSNAGIPRGGNARFLANVLAWSRGPDGAVIFDDAHQGLTAFYDAAAFFADPRLHATLGWLALLWLAFVLGTQPMRILRTNRRPLDENAYVEGSARYLAAVVPPADIGKRLIEEFLAELPQRVPRADRWQWLRTSSGAAERDCRLLERLHARAEAGARIDLIRLQTLLARLRGQLT